MELTQDRRESGRRLLQRYPQGRKGLCSAEAGAAQKPTAGAADGTAAVRENCFFGNEVFMGRRHDTWVKLM